jgi:hypothetical protein
MEPPFGVAEMVYGKAWGQHLPRDAVASLSHSLMQFAMPPAFAHVFPAHFLGRIASNLESLGNTRLLERNTGKRPSHQSRLLRPLQIGRQTIDP